MGENARLQHLADHVQRLPALPTVYLRVNELMASPNSSAADIGRVIAHDQAIAAKLLNVVNSSFYGFKQRISSVTRAMTMIGFRGLKDLILAMAALPALKTKSTHQQFDDTVFWSHAVGVAAGARAAAMILRLPEPEEAFTAGLLHDIGKLAEYQFLTEEFTGLMDEAHRDNETLHELELRNFGFSHVEVGQMLARKWQFPDSLIEIIGNHHNPSQAVRYGRETAIVHLADIIARAKLLGDPYDPRVPPLDRAAWEMTGLRRGQLQALMEKTDEEFEKGKAFISIIKDN